MTLELDASVVQVPCVSLRDLKRGDYFIKLSQAGGRRVEESEDAQHPCTGRQYLDRVPYFRLDELDQFSLRDRGRAGRDPDLPKRFFARAECRQ